MTGRLTSAANTTGLNLDKDIVVSQLWQRDCHNRPILRLLIPAVRVSDKYGAIHKARRIIVTTLCLALGAIAADLDGLTGSQSRSEPRVYKDVPESLHLFGKGRHLGELLNPRRLTGWQR